MAGVEFDYRIYNADGGEVEHCGNGARCFARFVHERGLTTSRRIRVHTANGTIELRLLDDGRVSVAMGVPRFAPELVPFDVGLALSGARAPRHAIEVGGQRVEIGALSIGNPHSVLVVDDVDTAPVATLGPAIEHHPAFPRRVNAGFLQVESPTRARLRVHERGVGETRACGRRRVRGARVRRGRRTAGASRHDHVAGRRARAALAGRCRAD